MLTPETPAPSVAELIRRLALEPHPEGGWYRRVYADSGLVAPADGRGARPAVTAIYYLLAAGQFSRWHRVRSAEIWSLLEGGPLVLATFNAANNVFAEHPLTGPTDSALAAAAGESLYAVPAGVWQAARALDDYALVSCVVVPGFDWADFAWLRDFPDDLAAMRAVLEGQEPSPWSECV
jgi:hypothetical protein